MFRLDLKLELWIKSYLHSKRDKIINKTIARFKRRHPYVNEDELREKLDAEAVRIYPIVDRSILHDRILRSRYILWVTIIGGTLIAGAFGAFTKGSFVPFATVMLTAVVAWVVSVGTVGISYNQRIKGAMDSVIAVYEKSYQPQLGMTLSNDLVLKIESESPSQNSTTFLRQELGITLQTEPIERVPKAQERKEKTTDISPADIRFEATITPSEEENPKALASLDARMV